MAALPLEQQASYSAIIDEILTSSDLNTISAKAIRKGLQERVGDVDLTPQKKAITALIMERFDKVQVKAQEDGSASGRVEPAPTVNGASHTQTNKRKASEDEDEMSEVDDSPAPKKVKKPKSERRETDAELAARLQAELNQLKRATRGGGAKRKATVKKEKKPKKKSAAKVGADDDSDLEGENGEKPEKEKKGGFHKPMNLSEPLTAMLGESQLSRPQTVKRIWAYVKERDLQDPEDKRWIMCDDAMRQVFKSDKIHMFTMNKVLANHLYPAEEAEEIVE